MVCVCPQGLECVRGAARACGGSGGVVRVSVDAVFRMHSEVRESFVSCQLFFQLFQRWSGCEGGSEVAAVVQVFEQLESEVSEADQAIGRAMSSDA